VCTKYGERLKQLRKMSQTETTANYNNESA